MQNTIHYTDKNMSEDKKEKKDKKKKGPKGPIRTGAVVPFIVFVALTIVFGMFFLDSTLKKAFEYGGTQANGAEVNIGEVVTSFSNLSIEIKDVQFTNKDRPIMNNFVIGKMQFAMLWDALLRGKIVIEDISVKDILVLTKRKSAGFVVPPLPPEEQAEEDKKVKEVLNKAQEEFKGNIFGDIAGVMSGDKSNISDGAKGDLESKKKLAALQVEMKNREKKVSSTLKNLPTKAEMNALQNRFNKIRWKDIGNLAKAPKVLKEIDKLKRDADKMIKAYNNANKVVNNHISYVNNATKEIPKFVEADVKAIQKRMKLPSIDTKSIAQMLFGDEILKKMNMAQEYHGKVKKYLPPKKTAEEKAAQKVKIAKRKIGVNYKFGTPKSYPLFWTKEVDINSQNSQGKIAGKITDITNDQNQIGAPTLLMIKGDFPGISVRDVKLKGSFDHRNGAHDSFHAVVGSYPVEDKALSNTDDVKFIIKKSDGNSIFSAKFDDDVVSFKVDNYFKNIVYNNSAKDKSMDLVLKGVAKSTKTISLKAKARGKWNNLKWDIKSNLAAAIQNTVKRQIQAKIDETKKKIRQDVVRQVAGEKAKIMKQVNDAKAQYTKAVSDGKKQLDGFKNKINKKKKKEEKKAKKNLLKGIKF